MGDSPCHPEEQPLNYPAVRAGSACKLLRADIVLSSRSSEADHAHCLCNISY